MSEVVVRVAAQGDLANVLAVQRDAFGRVAVALEIDPEALPPLNESLQQLRQLLETGTVFFVAVDAEGGVVGSVRAEEVHGVVAIGRLVVAGHALRQGIATALMAGLEEHFSAARRFELFTGSDALVPLALYGRLGYEEFKREAGPAVELVWLRKNVR